MRQSVQQERYPIFTLQIDREETDFQSVDQIVAYLKGCVEGHRAARFIAVFDHYGHTWSLAEGQIGEGILAAQNIVFCFGLTLPEPRALALRPRSIGVAETTAGFVITFMEAPMPVANMAMEEWAQAIRKPPHQPSERP
jgi:hypothetical protein